ncbi:MAG: archaeal heat shock protein Hsp20 [Candidatus Methanomethylicia archaeon]
MFYDDFIKNWKKIIEEMERRMREIEDMDIFNHEFKEEILPDDSRVRVWGPYIYGYSITIGPDGKIIKKEFGNIKQKRKVYDDIEEESEEPLVEVIDRNGEIKVIAEIPGVDEKDINVNVKDGKLIIKAYSKYKDYYKEVDLPSNINIKSMEKKYRNGILEVTIKRGN